MFLKIIGLYLILIFQLVFAIDVKSTSEGTIFSGAYAGVHCFDSSFCLAGFRTDIEYGGAKIRRSSDGGKSWSSFISIKDAQSARAYYFARSEKVILASGGAAGAEAGSLPNIFRSEDQGVTWKTIASAETIRALPHCSKATGVYNIIYLGNSTFIAGLEGVPVIIRTIDNGVTWTFDQKLGSTSRSIRHLYQMDDGSLLALAFGDGLWKSDDLAFSWRKILNSPEAIFSLTDFGNGVYLAGTTGQTGNFWSNRQAIYRSVDFGENWKLVTKVKTDSDLTYVRSIIKINDQLAYAFIAGNEYAQHDRALKTYISTNQGASWSVTPNFLKSTFGELNAIYDASSPSPDIFIFGGQPDSNLFWVKF